MKPSRWRANAGRLHTAPRRDRFQTTCGPPISKVASCFRPDPACCRCLKGRRIATSTRPDPCPTKPSRTPEPAMTHTNTPALLPQVYRSVCFAEDLAEGGDQARCPLRFPFPVAPYPSSPLRGKPAPLASGPTRVATAVLPRPTATGPTASPSLSTLAKLSASITASTSWCRAT